MGYHITAEAMTRYATTLFPNTTLLTEVVLPESFRRPLLLAGVLWRPYPAFWLDNRGAAFDC